MRFKNKLLVAIATFMLVSPSLFKAGATTPLCLHLTTGEKIVFAFENTPVMSFGKDNAITIKDAKKQITTNAYDKVRKVSFEDPAAISDALADADGSIVRDNASEFKLVGFKPGTQVVVANVVGQQLDAVTIGNEPVYVISLAAYPAGVYIISTGSISCKVAIN